MAEYDLTDEAAEDIREIVRYTFRTWGGAQVARYRADLKHCLNRLAEALGIRVYLARTLEFRLP